MDLTFEQQLIAAVWMVGNMHTDIDKSMWWHNFGPVWSKIAENSELAQTYADEMFKRGDRLFENLQKGN